MHLETALQGVIIGDRWLKSGIDIVITIIEGEDDYSDVNLQEQSDHGPATTSSWGLMTLLSGCITVASAALADAGIDCVDVVTGGVAAVVQRLSLTPQDILTENRGATDLQVILDPCLSEHPEIVALCVVGYLQSRDEYTELWTQSNEALRLGQRGLERLSMGILIDKAKDAASVLRLIVIEAIKETVPSLADVSAVLQ